MKNNKNKNIKEEKEIKNSQITNKNEDKVEDINKDILKNMNNYSSRNKYEINLKKINLNKSNKFDNEIDLLLKNKRDLKKKLKDNQNEGFNSNWNHSANLKLNTHNNENIWFKNKFLKNTPLRDKLLSDINKFKDGIILPNIKTPNININRENINNNISSNFSKSPKQIFTNNNEFSEKTNLFKNIKLNSNNNYPSDNTQTTTIATNSTKKFTSSKINNIQSLNDDSSQFSMGLISAGSTTNNNIIIPLLTMRRPASNFNNGGGILYNFHENNVNLGIIKNKENSENNNELFNYNKNKNARNKICKSQEMSGRFNASMKNKEICNLFPGMQKLIPNFHKIKIEKGMPNIKFGNALNKKISFEYNN